MSFSLESLLADFLILQAMKAQYPEYVKVFGSDRMDLVDIEMNKLFGGPSWDKHCEYIWQWYDTEYCDGK